MKKVLGILAILILAAAPLFAQSEVIVTNRGEVISVYTMEGATMGDATASSDTTAAFSGDLSVGDDLTVTDDAAVGGNLAVTGTTALTGALTLTAAPVLVSTNAAGAQTATLSNAPAAGDPVIWANVVVDGTEYVVPLFAKP